MTLGNTGARIVVNRAEVEALLRSSEVARDLGRRCEVGSQAAKRACPVSPQGREGRPSGTLRSSIGWTVGRDGDGLYGDIFAEDAAALFVEFPTRAHTIRVRDASVLTDGVHFFGQEVHHPGTEAQPFLVPGLQAAERANP